MRVKVEIGSEIATIPRFYEPPMELLGVLPELFSAYPEDNLGRCLEEDMQWLDEGLIDTVTYVHHEGKIADDEFIRVTTRQED